MALRWVLFLIAISFMPLFAHAQFTFFGLEGVEKTAILSFTPQHPEPGETVHFVVTSPVIDLPTASIIWYVNGRIAASSTGVTELDTTMGALGETSRVEVDVTNGDEEASAVATVIPTLVDLLYDGASYVPPFYLGRSLPSMGSPLRLQAYAHFRREGAYVPDSAILYSWKNDGIDIPHASGYGKNSLLISGPMLYGSETISVKATADGGLEGSAEVTIPSAKPFVALYEDNPLYGFMYHQLLPAQSLSTDAEMTIAAVPYYASASGPNDSSLQYEWRVNAQPIVSTTTSSEITLGAKDGGPAHITLDIGDDKNIFFAASGVWDILFSPHANLPASNDPNLLPVR